MEPIEQKSATPTDESPEAVVRGYLQAFSDRDIARSVDYYADDATVSFMTGVFKGRKAIEEWHKERFAANLQITKLGQIKASGQTVTVDATITSDRLKQWKITTIAGKATFKVQQGKIKETKLNPRLANPFENR